LNDQRLGGVLYQQRTTLGKRNEMCANSGELKALIQVDKLADTCTYYSDDFNFDTISILAKYRDIDTI